MDRELQKFGFKLSFGLNILGFIMFYRHKEHFIWFSSIGSISLLLAILYPKALSFFKKILDLIINFISWFTGIISIAILFYLIFTPMTILLKIFKKDILHQKTDKSIGSYWIKKKEAFLKDSYERMG